LHYLKERSFSVILFILMIFILSAAVQGAEIEDLAGRRIELPEKIGKIAAVGPGALRLIVYLNAEDKVVGVEEFEKRNQQRPYILAEPELLELPVIGPQFGGDAELIAAQEPDLIFASYLSPAQLNNLQKKTKTPVLSINNGSAGSMTEEDFKRALNFMAEILNKTKRAEELVNYFEEQKAELEKITKDSAVESVYIGGIGNKGAQGITSTEAAYPPFKYLSLNNIIEDENRGNFSISRERLLLENPELIFIDQGGIELVNKDLRREEFSYLKAYQDNNIYQLLPYNHYTTNFATMLADAYYLAGIVYPDEFEQIDAVKKADQIYQKFVGEPVYDEMAEIFGGFKQMKLN